MNNLDHRERASKALATGVDRWHQGYSAETRRRLRIIVEHFGRDWQQKYPDMSISRMYRTAIGDTREVVYVRVSADIKEMLWCLAEEWNTGLSDVIEELVQEQYAGWDEEAEGVEDDWS